jgi:hypothetical protein
MPAQLGVWAPWLSGLSEQVQSWLMSALAQLQVLLPSSGVAAAAPSGEFAGYDGIQSRGQIERLLMSEWLYADELPEEFLRRASSGELWYLKPALEQSSRSRALVVLFDSGPAQLGACRLAHLALWVLLARRAQLHGWEWRWGCLQQAQALFDSQQATALHTLMDTRSVQLFDAVLEQQWRAQLQDMDLAELWLIGPAAQAAPQLGAPVQRWIAVQEPLRIEPRILEVRSSAGQVELPLPEPRLAARLLRNPLCPDQIAPALVSAHIDQPFARKQTLMFSADGRRVAARMRDDRSCVFEIPNSPKDPRANSRSMLPTDAQTVALGIGPGRKNYSQIKVVDGRLRFFRAFGMTDPKTVDLEVDFAAVLLAPGVRWWCPLWLIGNQVLLLDQRRNLHQFELDPQTGQPRHRVLAKQLIAWQIDAACSRLEYLVVIDGRLALCTWPSAVAGTLLRMEQNRAQRMLMYRHGSTSGYLTEMTERSWWDLRSTRRIELAQGEIALGCWEANLVCLHRQGRCIRLHPISQTEVIEMEIGAELVAPVLAVNGGTLAGFSRHNELLLYSLARRTVVQRVIGSMGA